MESKVYFSNFIWRSLERWGAKGVSFIVSLKLASLLDPEICGTVAIVSVVIFFMEILLDSGFGNALIQKKNADELDFSTIFYFNIAFSLLLYVIIFFTAPFVEWFMKAPGLTSVLRVMGVAVIINGVKTIQQAYVTKNMLFRKFFFATLIGTIGAAILGIYLAYKGKGVWALAIQFVFNNAVDTILLWVLVKWRPKKEFSFERLKGMFSFGSKLLVSNLINQGYGEIRQLIVGKVYTKADLGFYNQGYRFPDLINANVNTSLKSILLPAISNVQEDLLRVKGILKHANQVSQYLMAPLVLGIAACAESFVTFFLGEQWLPCIPYLQLFCIVYIIGEMGNANVNAIVAIGRSDIRLRIEIINTVMNIVVLLATMFISPMAIAIGTIFCFLVGTFIATQYSRRLIDYSFTQQIKDILPNIIISVIMAACVWSINLLNIFPLIKLVIQIIIGIIIYFILSVIIKSEPMYYIIKILKSYKKK